VSDEQKREYVEAYLVKEMLELDPDNIFKNSGLRHISYVFLFQKNENAYFLKKIMNFKKFPL
jgi:hypothetical protein